MASTSIIFSSKLTFIFLSGFPRRIGSEKDYIQLAFLLLSTYFSKLLFVSMLMSLANQTSPEQRLLELRSHFEFMDVAIPSTPPITVSAETDIFQFNSVSGSGGGLGAGAGMGNGGSGVSSPANYANFFADGLSRNWDSDAGLEFF